MECLNSDGKIIYIHEHDVALWGLKTSAMLLCNCKKGSSSVAGLEELAHYTWGMPIHV